MRGRSAIVATVVVGCLLAASPLWAQDDPAAPPADVPAGANPAAGDDVDPNAGSSGPASTPGAADPDAPLPWTNEPPSDTAETEIAAEPVPAATPVVAAIRTKLADPERRKGVPEEDIAALETFYAALAGPPVWVTDMGYSAEAQAAIDEIHRAGDWGLSSATLDPPHAGRLPRNLDEQAEQEIELAAAILRYARFARGGRTEPVKLNRNFDQTPPLRDPKIVLTEIAAADAPDAYLRSLHPKHEQFERLRQALLKAREGDMPAKPEDIRRILINMERWRWMPEELGPFHVWLNVPEFMVHIVKSGETLHSEKIVVGKPVYATPMFSANLESIVFNPEWTVPPTIVREDILPRLRGGGGGWFSSRNTAILTQHKLTVRYNGRKVDPDRVDWNRVNMAAISFTQPPGPKNVLGKVKFLYPNKHAVYMHDTIKRELLNLQVRSEGHHCPRVANPGKVAGILLGEDQGMAPAEIEKLIAKGYNAAVNLDKPIPVHQTYFTAVVDDEGEIRTFGDLYKFDPVVAAVLAEEIKEATASAQSKAKNAAVTGQAGQSQVAGSAP